MSRVAGVPRRSPSSTPGRRRGPGAGCVAPYWMAERCVWAGETERALAWLERARDERQIHAMFLAVEPTFTPLAGLPGFQTLCRGMGVRGGSGSARRSAGA